MLKKITSIQIRKKLYFTLGARPLQGNFAIVKECKVSKFSLEGGDYESTLHLFRSATVR